LKWIGHSTTACLATGKPLVGPHTAHRRVVLRISRARPRQHHQHYSTILVKIFSQVRHHLSCLQASSYLLPTTFRCTRMLLQLLARGQVILQRPLSSRRTLPAGHSSALAPGLRSHLCAAPLAPRALHCPTKPALSCVTTPAPLTRSATGSDKSPTRDR